MMRLILATFAALAATAAFAQVPYPYPNPYRGVFPNPYYEGGPRPFGAPAAYCQKLCVQDQAPCDPPEFKRADGRCNNPTRGF